MKLRSKAMVESIRMLPGGLGSIVFKLTGIADVQKDDRIETFDKATFHVESSEWVYCLFEVYTIVHLTVMLPSAPLTIKLETFLDTEVTIHLSIQRAAERALMFGESSRSVPTLGLLPWKT